MAAAFSFFGLVSSTAVAQDITFKFVNPSFGGNSFNSAHLLAIAELDRPDPPEADTVGIFGDNFGEVSQADLFAEQLERTILGRLSSDISNAIFGENAEPSGEFRFDTTSVQFETALNGTIFVTISDTLTNGQTVIEIPSFLTQSAQ